MSAHAVRQKKGANASFLAFHSIQALGGLDDAQP